MKAIQVGDKIHYSGDMANDRGWYAVVGRDETGRGVNLTVEEIEGPGSGYRVGERPPRKNVIPESIVGNVYQGHCDPRHVTEAAYNAWKEGKKVYTMHTDPGHGWLEVPVAELLELKIAGEITPYSMLSRDGTTAYLEEDYDLSTYARAKGWKPDGTAPIKERYYPGDCPIRHLPRYHQ